jgi:hypothetical protein
MGQCSSSRLPDAEKVVRQQQPAAAAWTMTRFLSSKRSVVFPWVNPVSRMTLTTDVLYRQKQQQRKRKTAGQMKQPYHASSHEDLVLMVSLDAITKIGWIHLGQQDVVMNIWY